MAPLEEAVCFGGDAKRKLNLSDLPNEARCVVEYFFLVALTMCRFSSMH